MNKDNAPKEFQILPWGKEIDEEVRNTLRRGKTVKESETPILGELISHKSSKIPRMNQEIANEGLGVAVTVEI
jgi:hypothetical protein